MDDNRPVKKAFNFNYLSVALIYIWSLAFLLSVPSIKDPQSRLFPIIVSVLAIVLSTVFLLKTKFSRGKKEELPDFTGSGMAIAMTALLLAYVGIIRVIGFYLATPLYLYATMWVLGQRNKKLMVIISVLMPVGVYLFFRLLLNMRIPEGILLPMLMG